MAVGLVSGAGFVEGGRPARAVLVPAVRIGHLDGSVPRVLSVLGFCTCACGVDFSDNEQRATCDAFAGGWRTRRGAQGPRADLMANGRRDQGPWPNELSHVTGHARRLRRRDAGRHDATCSIRTSCFPVGPELWLDARHRSKRPRLTRFLGRARVLGRAESRRSPARLPLMVPRGHLQEMYKQGIMATFRRAGRAGRAKERRDSIWVRRTQSDKSARARRSCYPSSTLQIRVLRKQRGRRAVRLREDDVREFN